MDAATASAPPPRLLQHLVPGIWYDYPVQTTYGGCSKIRLIALSLDGYRASPLRARKVRDTTKQDV